MSKKDLKVKIRACNPSVFLSSRTYLDPLFSLSNSMMCRIQRRTLGERVFVSDGWFGTLVCSPLLVSFFLTDAASESAGGNSEAKVLGGIVGAVIH